MNKTMMEILACPIDKNHPLELFEINQKEDVEIFFMGEIGNVVKANSIASLLPFSFDSTYL